MDKDKTSHLINKEHTFKPLHKEEDNTKDITEAYPVSYRLPESDTIYAVENDKFYYHLKSDETCRSLVEVYDFIHRPIPFHKLQKMKKKTEGESMSKKIRGASLLMKTKVATDNLQTKTISLRASPQVVGECPHQTIDNLVKIDNEGEASGGNKERVRAEDPLTEGECTIDRAIKTTDISSDNVVPYITFEFL